jgi:hypothetical protein
MTQLLYTYNKCSECGKEGFQWGMLITIPTRTFNEESGEFFYQDINVFICHICIKTIDNKLTDLEKESKDKTKMSRKDCLTMIRNRARNGPDLRQKI